MRSLSARELLRAWEQGQTQTASDRSLLLLGAACPELDREALSRLSIGERDRLLLRVREQTFGSNLVAVAPCPDCGERVELSFGASDIAGESSPASAETFFLQTGEFEVRFRLLTSSDLSDAQGLTSVQKMRAFLIQRSVVSAQRGGQNVSSRDLPSYVIDLMAEEMSQADPLANIQLAVTCSRCSRAWDGVLDVGAFFWTEIQGWAQRTLQEVHRLASVYGWSESDILAMSAWRRQCYLSLIGK